METYSIPDSNWGKFQKELTKIDKRAQKLGSLPVQVREIGTKTLEDSKGRPYLVHVVEVDGVAPTLAGWSFIGTLDHTTEAGVLLRTVPGESLPEKYREATPICDHCQLNRKRKETFIVRHENGDHKQVGRQCVTDFLGGKDPKAVAASLQYIWKVTGLCSDAEEEGWEGIASERGMYLETWLTATARELELHGWVSRTVAYNEFRTATADEVSRQFTPPYNSKEKKEKEEFFGGITEKHNALAQDAIQWALSLRDKADLSDYEHNVTVVAEGGVVTPKLAGIATSIVPVYKRNLERAEQAKVEKSLTANSKPLGKTGDKVEVTARVLGVRELEGKFGVSFLVKLATSEGCAACWFASRDPGLKSGEVVRLKGSVKKTQEYRGVIETQLTRCKVV